jgi:hypothetical protein
VGGTALSLPDLPLRYVFEFARVFSGGYRMRQATLSPISELAALEKQVTQWNLELCRNPMSGQLNQVAAACD